MNNADINDFVKSVIAENYIQADTLLKKIVSEKIAAYRQRIEQDKFLGENRVIAIEVD